MKSVLMSIQPKWCELIASGKKTVEVRKTKPKIDVPFKCYIYETKDKKFENIGVCGHKADGTPYIYKHNGGKVIGEFICNAIISHCEMANADIAEYQGCIKREKLFEYAKGKELYGWHISDLVIYDKPRELSEFHLARHCFNYKNVDIVENAMGDYVTQYFNNSLCRRCMNYDNGLNWCEKIDGKKAITRPPQSWCYVEGVNINA